jgi:UDP-GlcNAc:undecaprenyl-phosphate GlcNAc-1-phosphate transferase
MNMLKVFFVAFGASLVFGAIFLIVSQKISFFKTRFRDVSGRVSKLGGMGIVLSFFVAMRSKTFVQTETALLWGFFISLLLGAADDFLSLAPLKKLIGQALIALFLVASGIKLQIMYFPDLVNIILSVFWFLCLMNAVNFLDIVDGLAGGVTSLCALTFAVIATAKANTGIALISLALAGANLGFLRYNLSPKKLYMGETGSLLNGCALGAIAIMISYAAPGREAALFAPLLVLALPLYDLFFVIVMRLKARRSVVKKSRDHFILRLLENGLSAKKAVFLMLIFNLLFNLAAILLLHVSNASGLLLFSVSVLGWLGIAYRLS